MHPSTWFSLRLSNAWWVRVSSEFMSKYPCQPSSLVVSFLVSTFLTAQRIIEILLLNWEKLIWFIRRIQSKHSFSGHPWLRVHHGSNFIYLFIFWLRWNKSFPSHNTNHDSCSLKCFHVVYKLRQDKKKVISKFLDIVTLYACNQINLFSGCRYRSLQLLSNEFSDVHFALNFWLVD